MSVKLQQNRVDGEEEEEEEEGEEPSICGGEETAQTWGAARAVAALLVLPSSCYLVFC